MVSGTLRRAMAATGSVSLVVLVVGGVRRAAAEGDCPGTKVRYEGKCLYPDEAEERRKAAERKPPRRRDDAAAGGQEEAERLRRERERLERERRELEEQRRALETARKGTVPKNKQFEEEPSNVQNRGAIPFLRSSNDRLLGKLGEHSCNGKWAVQIHDRFLSPDSLTGWTPRFNSTSKSLGKDRKGQVALVVSGAMAGCWGGDFIKRDGMPQSGLIHVESTVAMTGSILRSDSCNADEVFVGIQASQGGWAHTGEGLAGIGMGRSKNSPSQLAIRACGTETDIVPVPERKYLFEVFFNPSSGRAVCLVDGEPAGEVTVPRLSGDLRVVLWSGSGEGYVYETKVSRCGKVESPDVV